MNEQEYSAPAGSVNALTVGDGQEACRIAAVAELHRLCGEIRMRQEFLEPLSDENIGLQQALDMAEERLTEIGGEW